MSSVLAALGVTTRPRTAVRAWLKAVVIVVLLASVFFLYAPSSESLMELWSDTGKTTYTHGYVVAALMAWLVLRRRDDLAANPWLPSITGSLLAVVTGLAWMVSVRAGIELFHQLLLLFLLWLSVWAMFGLRTALQLWLPIGFLIFAIPIWDQVNFLLQEATVRAVALMLDVTALPAWVEGNFVHLAAGTFEIAGGCSGIHFFIVSLALATLYGEIDRDSWKVRIQLLGLATGLALLTNWLRVYIIIVAGHMTDMQHYLVSKEHYTFGWMVFAVMMLVFFLLARRIAPAVQERRMSLAAAVPAASRVLALLVATACVFAIPVADYLRSVEPATPTSSSTLLPPAPAGWSRVETQAMSTWNPVFAGADHVERARYTSLAGPEVQVFIASYATQQQGKELVAYGNGLVGPGDGDVVQESRAASAELARELFVRSPDGRSVIRYYYDIGGHRTDRGIYAQLWYGVKSIRGQVRSSVIALRAQCVPDCGKAQELLNDFSESIDARKP